MQNNFSVWALWAPAHRHRPQHQSQVTQLKSVCHVQICNNPSSELESKSQRSQKQFLIEDYIPPAKVTKDHYTSQALVLTWFQMQKSSHDLTHTYCWDSQLAEPSFVAAPVSAFSHAPMADGWDNIIIGMKVNILDTCFMSTVCFSLNVSCSVSRLRLKTPTQTLFLGFSALLSGLQLCSAFKDTRSCDISQMYPHSSCPNGWIYCRCFCAMRALARMAPETSGWTFAVKRYHRRKSNFKSLSRQISRFTQWAGVPRKGNPWFLQRASRWLWLWCLEHMSKLDKLLHCQAKYQNCCIIRQSTMIGRSSLWKDWLAHALSPQRSTRFNISPLILD